MRCPKFQAMLYLSQLVRRKSRSKNVFMPDRAEIASLETYIEKYLWGGMQMTDREKYPYAIYGIPNFKANRASADEGRNGQAHVWRIYDYPHIVMLYFRMYQIAKFYPAKVKYLDAGGYLERAFRTAIASRCSTTG